MNYKSYYESPIGKIILTSNGDKLTGLWFTTSRFNSKLDKPDLELNNNIEIFIKTKKWLDKYFSGENPNPNEIPLLLIGTEFSNKVWDILKTIPYGKTMTYGDIAKIIAKEKKIKKMSAQAIR